MARELDEMPLFRTGGAANRKYPWEKWMNGSPWLIKQGEDFTCTMPVMIQNLRTRGHRERISVTARQLSQDEVAFQFFPPR